MTRPPNLFCDEEDRRASVGRDDALNGIDYLEVVTEPPIQNQRLLEVHFMRKETPAGQASLNAMLAALDGSVPSVRVVGGVRTPNVKVTTVRHVTDHLEVGVSEPGDFSDYTLVIAHASLDPVYSRITFNFKAGCPARFDCRPRRECPPEPQLAPPVDYLAKDYASFRQALLDLAHSLVPGWRELHEADVGIALVELLAYVGDYLSYYQDAVANEAYLETARQRVSVTRLARLIDYTAQDGASARAFVHFRVGLTGTIPAGTQVLARINAPLGARLPPHPPEIAPALKGQALAATPAVFETIDALDADPRLDRIEIYTWGDRLCCLPKGATSLELVGDLTGPLKPGAFLLFEEIAGTATGREADADPTHRQIVRLTTVERTEDRLLPDASGARPAPLTRVAWDRSDALTFPLCVSIRMRDAPDKTVSVARGNLALADHGRSVSEWFPGDPADPRAQGIKAGRRAFRFRLKQGPLSFRTPLPPNRPAQSSAKDLLATDPQQIEAMAGPCLAAALRPRAQVNLDLRTKTGESLAPRLAPDLLSSGEFDLDFTVETENDRRALIRFGDGTYGEAPPDGAFILATYRVGLGAAGNVGADSLSHVVNPAVAGWPVINEVRNPMPAWGGNEPESLERIRRLAPDAFRAEQYRAVVEADYARAAEKHPEVSKAVATFRWTGSWHTVFLTIDPRGRNELTPALKRKVRDWVTCYTQAGYDLEVKGPIFVPLEILVDVCVKPNHFRADIEAALLRVLSNRRLVDGARAFFHPDNFTFGQPVYLSRLYAALKSVEGVESAVVKTFQRFGRVRAGELEQGFLPVGRLEIARLDNDPSFPENGALRLNMLGGK